MNIVNALTSLRPNAEWQYSEKGGLNWLDTVQTEPTSEEIDAEVLRLQTAYDAQAYARSRKAEYDKLNQDEMRYDDLVNGTTTWQDAIAAIKTSIPKG
jgi:hypothetical protein